MKTREWLRNTAFSYGWKHAESGTFHDVFERGVTLHPESALGKAYANVKVNVPDSLWVPTERVVVSYNGAYGERFGCGVYHGAGDQSLLTGRHVGPGQATAGNNQRDQVHAWLIGGEV